MRHLRRSMLFAALVASAIVAPQAVFAGTDTTSLGVQTEILASCVFPVASTPVDFGPLDTTLGNVPSSGTITVKCTTNTLAKLGLDAGLNAVAGQRKVKDAGTNLIDYSLWQDAAHTVAWLNADPNQLSFTATGVNETKTVYGLLNYSSVMPLGTYTDTVVATVTF